jgi:hypothetical protein
MPAFPRTDHGHVVAGHRAGRFPAVGSGGAVRAMREPDENVSVVRRVPLAMVAGSLMMSGLRRLAHRTGMTDDEAYGPLPGDDVIPHPMLEWNRGVTVTAAPEVIWPWLVQMGYGRAGWYTPEGFDRWANRWVWRQEKEHPYQPSPWTLLSDHQQVAVGDVIADGPGYAAFFRVMAVDWGRSLVYYSIRHPWRGKPVDPTDEAALRAREVELRQGGVFLEFSWAFVLRPIDSAQTRLLYRARSNVGPQVARLLDIPLGLVDVYEGMGMLYGIRSRVHFARTETPRDETRHH